MELGAKAARFGNWLLSLLAFVLIALMLLYGGCSLWDNSMTMRGAFVSEELMQFKPVAEDGDNLSLEELRQRNPEVCGWLTVDGTHIDYPFVQGEDDMEYINKDVMGDFALSGAVFLSCENKSDCSDRYNLLYGHHMEGGAMFGDVAEFTDPSYFDSHTTGTLYLPGGSKTITFFACIAVDAYDSCIYHPGNLTDEEQTALLAHIGETAVQQRDIDCSQQDCLIALSTCAQAETNGRIVLFGRLD